MENNSILSWSSLTWAIITLLGVFFVWQLVIARRLFVYENWHSAAFWISASVGWLFFVWRTFSTGSSLGGPLVVLCVIALLVGAGVLHLTLVAAKTDKLIQSLVSGLVLFGIIIGFTSKVPAYGWSILLGALGGATIAQAVAGTLFVTEKCKPPKEVLDGDRVERI